MTSERADSFSDVQCIGLRFQSHSGISLDSFSDYKCLTSIWIILVFESTAKLRNNCKITALCLFAIYRVTDEDSISKTAVLPILFLTNITTALKKTQCHFY